MLAVITSIITATTKPCTLTKDRLESRSAKESQPCHGA